MFVSSDFGKTLGGIESPKVKKTADGLLVTVTGLSPVMVSWHAAAPSVIDRIADGVKTGDPGVIVWLLALPVSALGAAVMLTKKKRKG